jgi:4-hydroxy-tetrahydrodipicolinate synthase
MADIFTGTGVALVTPFNADKSIDQDSLRKVIDHVIAGGVDFLVALGTTGESVTLTANEKKEVVDIIISHTRSRVPIVMGMGSNFTAGIVEAIRNTDFTGISGILSVAPYYNRPSQQGLYEHFSAIAGACPVPVIVYNVPGRTSSNISAETIVKLAKDHANIVAVKEASGNFLQIMQIIRNKPKDFKVLSGDDTLTLPILSMGGAGVISVIANSHPGEFSEMVHAALKKDLTEARELHYRLLDYIGALFEEGSPSGIKAALQIMGLCSDEVRLPLISASDGLKSRLSRLMKAI